SNPRMKYGRIAAAFNSAQSSTVSLWQCLRPRNSSVHCLRKLLFRYLIAKAVETTKVSFLRSSFHPFALAAIIKSSYYSCRSSLLEPENLAGLMIAAIISCSGSSSGS
ncbi:1646_t:CDS:2, partial [Dentiscutata erythropus]